MDKRFVSRFGLFIFFFFFNFASEKKQIRYLWSYVDRLGGVFAPASMENRACLVMGLSTHWLTPSVYLIYRLGSPGRFGEDAGFAKCLSVIINFRE